MLRRNSNFVNVPPSNGTHLFCWKIHSTYGTPKSKLNKYTVIPRSKKNKQVSLMPTIISQSASSSNEHIGALERMINMKEKGLKDISTPQLAGEISRIVTTLSVSEEMRVAEALDISDISFGHEETVLKEEVGINEEEEEFKPNLSEAGPSKKSNFTTDDTDSTVKNTQSVDLYECHVCNKHFNQYDLELHFVTHHSLEEML